MTFDDAGRVSGVRLQSDEVVPADAVVLATNYHTLTKWVPPERAAGDERFSQIARLVSVPILGVHLWFDRPVLSSSHAALIEGPLQWLFRKEGGRERVAWRDQRRARIYGLRQGEMLEGVREAGEGYAAGGARSKALAGRDRRGEASDFFGSSGHGPISARPGAADFRGGQSVPRRRLHANGLAGHDGGSGPERLPGSRGGCSAVAAGAIKPTVRCCRPSIAMAGATDPCEGLNG